MMFVFGVWGVCGFVDVVNRLMSVCCVRLTTPTTYTRKPQTPKPKPQRDNNADPNAAAAAEERFAPQLAAHKAQLEDKIRQLAVEHGIDPNDVRILSKEVCEDWVDGWVDGYMIMYH